MGFNIIAFEGWWSYIEPKYSDVGVYSNSYLTKLRTIVDWSKSVGLEVMYQCRIDYGVGHDWDGWATFDYVFDNAGTVYPYWTRGNNDHTEQWATGGLARYGNMLEYFASKFPDIIINPEKFPYHQTGVTESKMVNWDDNVFPYLKQRIRDGGNNKPVVYVPVHQVAYNLFKTNQWYGDDVILGLGHFTPWSVCIGGNWNYITTEIDYEFKNVKTLRAKFPNMNIMSIEFVGLMADPVDSQISQSRLDCAEYILIQCEELQMGWLYHCISWLNGGHDTILLGQSTPTNTFNFREEILDLLNEYMLEIPEPEPPVASFTYFPLYPQVNDTIYFVALGSSDTDGTIVSYMWDFGDGDTSTNQNPTHAYDQEGSYSVTLTVTDDDGLTDTATVSIAEVVIPEFPSYTLMLAALSVVAVAGAIYKKNKNI